MKLLKYNDVVDIIERVTNEAIEKKKNKATLQKMLICEIDALEPAETDQAETDQNDYSSWKRISTIMGDYYVCTKCGLRTKNIVNHNFCPYCGREMR